MFRAKLLVVAALFLCAARTAMYADSYAAHPDDTGATYIGSFTCLVNLSNVLSLDSSRGDLILHEALSESCRTQFEVCVWYTSYGAIDYVIRAETIRFTGNGGGLVDLISAKILFDVLTAAVVEQGAVHGFSNCSATCNPGDTCVVYQASCVQRQYSGVATTFVACDSTAYCSRRYVVCCPIGPTSPSAVCVPTLGTTTCSPTGALLSGCEVTCQ